MNYNTQVTNDNYVNNTYMNFFEDNYMYIMIILIVIIMVIIGYIADKNNLLKTKKSEKENKEASKTKSVEEIVPVSNTVIQDEEMTSKQDMTVQIPKEETSLEAFINGEELQTNDIFKENENLIPTEKYNNDLNSTFSEEISDEIDTNVNDMYELNDDIEDEESIEPIINEEYKDVDLETNSEIKKDFANNINSSSTFSEEISDEIDTNVNDMYELNDDIEDEESIEPIINEEYKDVDLETNSEIKKDFANNINSSSTFSEEIPDEIDTNVNDMYELNNDTEVEKTEAGVEDNQDAIVDMELPDIDSINIENKPDDFWEF